MIENTFRKDLYYRLNVINIRIPPLRERKEDIPQLAEFLLVKHAAGKPAPKITPALHEAMANYDWPGNIRELENVVRKLLVLREASLVVRKLRDKITRQLAYNSMQVISGQDSVPNKTILEQVTNAKHQAETAAIITALDSTHWNRKKAALLLKIDYKALLYKMKKLGIDDRTAISPASSC